MKSWIAALVALVALPVRAQTLPVESLAVESEIAPFTIEDQFGQAHAIDLPVQAILFARDMDASRLIDQALRARGETLESRHLVWISDISGMPGLISRFIAIPAMRRRPYRMLLDRDGSLTQAFPSAKGQITLMRLAELRVTALEQLSTLESLEAALAPLLQVPETPPRADPGGVPRPKPGHPEGGGGGSR